MSIRRYLAIIESAQTRPVPTVGYHVTTAKKLPRIREEGLRGSMISRIDGRGGSTKEVSPVYFWDTLQMAQWFKNYQNDNGSRRVILTVDLTGLNLKEDDEAKDMSEWSSRFPKGYDGGAWMTFDPVDPSRIRT